MTEASQPSADLTEQADAAPVTGTTQARRRVWLRPGMVAPALALVAVAYIVVPVRVQLSSTSGDDYSQHTTPRAVLSAADGPAIQRIDQAWAQITDGRPLVLTFHDITTKITSKYSVTPGQFELEMAALYRLGAHTINAQEYASWVKGQPLPPRSVMITFDDGTRGVWRYADRILERYGFRATAFIITGFVGTRHPYYLRWSEIDRLGATGRWSFEAHAHIGHVRIPVDPTGGTGSFMSNQAWDKRTGYEALAQYTARVSNDLDTCIAILAEHGLGRGHLFAFPYSDYGAPNDRPAVANALIKIVKDRFTAVFNDDATPHDLGGPFQYTRLSVTDQTSLETFATNLLEVFELNGSRAG